MYANALRESAHLSQAQLGVAFAAGDFGLFFGVFNGFLYDRCGPRVASATIVLSLTGASDDVCVYVYLRSIPLLILKVVCCVWHSTTLLPCATGGYLALAGVIKGVVPGQPWIILVAIYLVIGQGSNMTNCVAITTNVHNFEAHHKGKVVGCLKTNFGVQYVALALHFRNTPLTLATPLPVTLLGLPQLGLIIYAALYSYAQCVQCAATTPPGTQWPRVWYC